MNLVLIADFFATGYIIATISSNVVDLNWLYTESGILDIGVELLLHFQL